MSLITYLTRIQFERGAVCLLAEEIQLLGVSRPLIVTDRGVAAAGILDVVIAAGRLSSPAVFDETPGNPTEDAVLMARDLYREAGCDSVIAVGGGSPLDLAKAVAVLVTHAEPLEQYAAILGGLPRITANKPPVVAIPTTSGTGSEVGRAALITLNDGRKLGFISPHMIPSVAICDPELTLKLPAALTAPRPAWTRSPTASRPISRRARTCRPRRSPSTACRGPCAIWSAPIATAPTSRRARV